MEKLQDIIDKKATDRLNKDLQDLNDTPYNKFYSLFRDAKIYINVGTVEKPKNINVCSVFSADGFKQRIFDANIEKYKAEESIKFIEKVAALQQQLDELHQ